nr:putative transposase (putative), gypsy type [Tanacetum cinerariifolium]
MSTIHDIKSKLNQKALDALCTKYHIPACVHPSLPGSNKNILQSPDGKIGVYTRFFDFANYRIPLSQFLVDVLDHFHIYLSQLSVFGAAKVSHFEILCRVHGFWPSVKMDLFAFIHHSDPTKVRIVERELAEREVKFLKMIEGRIVLLSPPVTTASKDNGDNINKLFDDAD